MTSQFIQRPILSIVISVIITLLGFLALLNLPITQFPSIAPPEVNVTVEYTGANAETVTKAAIVPLERAINGVPGMKYMSSDAGNDGVGVVQIIFEIGTDPDIAAVNVQNRVAAVMGELPEEVIKNGVKIAKEENSMLMYLSIYSKDTTLKEKFLYNFADINVLAELKRVKGVGYADILGAKEYAMRIWLNPTKMLAHEISTQEFNEALQKQNIEAAPGKIGENSDRTNYSLQYVLKYTGKYNTIEQYENIPIKADETGKILRIKDIAKVEFGTTYFDVEAKLNGNPTASIMIKQLPGSNANEVIKNIKAKMEELKAKTFLEGMDYEIGYDVSRFLDASIHEVIKTFIEAFLLVSIVVFIFLQDFRSTLIPALAIPVSLIGTFFFMQLLGFSLNLITLFALVLAIGIVIDNAIVVVEAVHVKMEAGASPKEATQDALKEISGAIIAITLIMSAVFIPTAFMGGPSGIFYKQFSITIAIAIVLSGISALTLTPALCALFLKNNHQKKTAKPKGILARFFKKFNTVYEKTSNLYERIVKVILNYPILNFLMIAFFTINVILLGKWLPDSFIPNEDQGMFYVSITTPSGATLERTKEIVNEVQRKAQKLSSVESISSLAGTNILSDGTGATYGTVLVNLKNWDEREQSVYEVIDELTELTKDIKGAKLEFFPPPAVPGYGNASGFELRLLDKTGTNDFKKMEEVVKKFIDDLKKQPEIKSAFSIFDANYPQYLLTIDEDKAAQKGVDAENIMSELQTLLGSEYVTNFIRFGQMYKVMVQSPPENRAKPEDVLKFYVKNNQDKMVQLSAFTTIKKVYGLDQITRYNMFPSAELNGEPQLGYSSGDAINVIRKVASEQLPKGYDIDWAGITRDEVAAGNEAIYIFIICLVFVYLLLSAQYESFILPLPVILSLSAGIFGAFLFLWCVGLENNIYAKISLLMLIGLLGKNAILIVEYAALKHKEGGTTLQAAIEAAVLRLRPILMTSFAFIAGLIPLAAATGAGAIGNQTIGYSSIGGMLIGTLIGVFLIPCLYYYFANIIQRFTKDKQTEETPYTETL
ncbi:MAG: efflux RND transporter permease subunit [Cytophagales bacterium]|nr:MAG: efflux RND transporter permease subunit [Cytophagales bacterium]